MSSLKARYDPTWHRTGYLLAAQILQANTEAKERSLVELDENERSFLEELCLQSTTPPSIPGLKAAEDQALSTAAQAASVLRRSGSRWVARRPAGWAKLVRWRRSAAATRLIEFLNQTLEPSAVVLYWATRVEEGAMNPSQLLSLTRTDSSAKALDRRKFKPQDAEADPPSVEWLEAYVQGLLTPKQAHRGNLKRLAGWTGVSRHRAPLTPNYRVRYNLACLFSRAARRAHPETKFRPESDLAEFFLDESLRQLRDCLDQVGRVRREKLVRWAWRDPGLAFVRLKRKAAFRSLVGF